MILIDLLTSAAMRRRRADIAAQFPSVSRDPIIGVTISVSSRFPVHNLTRGGRRDRVQRSNCRSWYIGNS